MLRTGWTPLPAWFHINDPLGCLTIASSLPWCLVSPCPQHPSSGLPGLSPSCAARRLSSSPCRDLSCIVLPFGNPLPLSHQPFPLSSFSLSGWFFHLCFTSQWSSSRVSPLFYSPCPFGLKMVYLSKSSVFMFLTLGTSDIWGLMTVCSTAVLCIAGCVAASLASPH